MRSIGNQHDSRASGWQRVGVEDGSVNLSGTGTHDEIEGSIRTRLHREPGVGYSRGAVARRLQIEVLLSTGKGSNWPVSPLRNVLELKRSVLLCRRARNRRRVLVQRLQPDVKGS